MRTTPRTVVQSRSDDRVRRNQIPLRKIRTECLLLFRCQRKPRNRFETVQVGDDHGIRRPAIGIGAPVGLGLFSRETAELTQGQGRHHPRIVKTIPTMHEHGPLFRFADAVQHVAQNTGECAQTGRGGRPPFQEARGTVCLTGTDIAPCANHADVARTGLGGVLSVQGVDPFPASFTEPGKRGLGRCARAIHHAPQDRPQPGQIVERIDGQDRFRSRHAMLVAGS